MSTSGRIKFQSHVYQEIRDLVASASDVDLVIEAIRHLFSHDYRSALYHTGEVGAVRITHVKPPYAPFLAVYYIDNIGGVPLVVGVEAALDENLESEEETRWLDWFDDEFVGGDEQP